MANNVPIQEGVRYQVSRIVLNRQALDRLQARLEKHLTEGARIYAEFESIIKQGDTPTTNA